MDLDLGSFVLERDGVRWAVDLGSDDSNMPGYFGAERFNYYRLRTESHNTVMLEAWMQAAGSFAKTLNEKGDRKETLGSWREVLALWIETANTALLEAQRSDKYLETQRELLKASTDLRLAQQEIAAFYSEVFGYPTRAELDDVHRSVTELRRELRALERASRDASTPRKARTRRRTSVKAGNDTTGA